MLQVVLGGHPSIHTFSESWLALNPLYALKHDGHRSDYDSAVASKALRHFLNVLPNGEECYDQATRLMLGHLYEAALSNSGKEYFLDKTPRYYYIIPDLMRIFPDARFIFLFRNPVAVLVSTLRTWVQDDWFLLERNYSDLVRAPGLLLDGREKLGDKAAVVHYEKYVQRPEEETRRLCAKIGLNFNPRMLTYSSSVLGRYRYGAIKDVSLRTSPEAANVGNWKETVARHPQVWRLAHDYLRILGKDVVQRMGYDFDELTREVEGLRPKGANRMTVSFQWLTEMPKEQRRASANALMRLLRLIQRLTARSPRYHEEFEL